MVKVDAELDNLLVEIKMGDFELKKEKPEKDSLIDVSYKDMVKIFGKPKRINNKKAEYRIGWSGEINGGLVFKIKDCVISSDYKANKYWRIEAEYKITIILLKAYIEYMQFISL